VAVNTVEGRVLEKLLEKLQEIRDALEDDTVFNVVGEILPAAYIERILRDYYSGRLGEHDLEDRFLRNVNEERFREICQNALEGLATRSLNLPSLVERRAKSQERRVVPETVARFMVDSSTLAGLALKSISTLPHTFDPGPTPPELKRHEQDPDWRLGNLVRRYPRFSTDRKTADENNLEWVTPGHPLFEALRRRTVERARPSFVSGGCFYSVTAEKPSRLDIYRARVVDGLGQVVHERLFAVEISETNEPVLKDPWMLGNLQPAKVPDELPPILNLPEPRSFLDDKALTPFLKEVENERVSEVDRVAKYVEISLTELIGREDLKVGRLSEEKDRGVEGAAGQLAQVETRQAELMDRRDRRRQELARQKQLTLQGVERLTTVLILSHPDSLSQVLRHLRPDPEVEAIAMREAIRYEENAGRRVEDVHERDLGYDLSSVDSRSGELRLIEVKGLSHADGSIMLTPNEFRVAQDRRDCFWLYVVTQCKTTEPNVRPHRDPVTFGWRPVEKIQYYELPLSGLK